VLFVCTANSARSHLAAALWRRASIVPAVSAGTRPGPAIDPGAINAARRHHLPLPQLRPRHISQVQDEGDLVVTVCDLAREEFGGQGRSTGPSLTRSRLAIPPASTRPSPSSATGSGGSHRGWP
jgi:protein-tyrosine-phosphatase